MSKKSMKSITNREFFEQEHPAEYAALLNLSQKSAARYDCRTRLTNKRVIVEVESFTNIEDVKKYKLDYNVNIASELQALYDKLTCQQHTMFYPYYSCLTTIVDKYLRERGIKLIPCDGVVILKYANDDNNDESFGYNREHYEMCLNRICELITDPVQSHNDTSESITPEDSNYCAWAIWSHMSEAERRNVYSQLNSEDRELLKKCLRISGYDGPEKHER